jgi:hypothetical protein
VYAAQQNHSSGWKDYPNGYDSDHRLIARISVSLENADEALLDAFTAPDRPEHVTLEVWAAEHDMPVRDSSEAAIMRILARVGAAALREQALERGYAILAGDTTDDDRTERRARRARYAEN